MGIGGIASAVRGRLAWRPRPPAPALTCARRLVYSERQRSPFRVALAQAPQPIGRNCDSCTARPSIMLVAAAQRFALSRGSLDRTRATGSSACWAARVYSSRMTNGREARARTDEQDATCALQRRRDARILRPSARTVARQHVETQHDDFDEDGADPQNR